MASHDDRQIDRWVEERLRKLNPDPGWQPDPAAAFGRARELRAAGERSERVWPLLLASATVLVVVFLTVPPARLFAERCVSACVDQASRVTRFLREGRSDAGSAMPSVDALVGTVAPDFTRPDASGAAVSLSALRGQVVLLNFWATWCPPCLTEMPWFTEFQQTYGSRGFRVVGVSIDEDGWGAVQPFLEEHAIGYPVVLGDEVLTASYGGVNTLPMTMIVDRTGRVASTHVGLIEKAMYEAAIRAALTE